MNIHVQAVRKVLESGHRLFNCLCGRIHVDPMGMVTSKGWTGRELARMYVIGAVGAVLLVTLIVFLLSTMTDVNDQAVFHLYSGGVCRC